MWRWKKVRKQDKCYLRKSWKWILRVSGCALWCFYLFLKVNINNHRTCSKQFKSLKEQCRPTEIKTHMFIYSCIQYMCIIKDILWGKDSFVLCSIIFLFLKPTIATNLSFFIEKFVVKARRLPLYSCCYSFCLKTCSDFHRALQVGILSHLAPSLKEQGTHLTCTVAQP